MTTISSFSFSLKTSALGGDYLFQAPSKGMANPFARSRQLSPPHFLNVRSQLHQRHVPIVEGSPSICAKLANGKDSGPGWRWVTSLLSRTHSAEDDIPALFASSQSPAIHIFHNLGYSTST
ncbi:unnamed protein product [Lepeophtheirus salmonis]|uniref:(salmon louse) hypothetical protein n=1 Tax=Lepeophtheirus salmonis TaxID=72036 RepID=A0A7R8CLL0_LEPSM|nr:unnamed protein product [Lepeophtheirus salmonis]CAF2858343.1 unnamed protein product [Lepeophtheirus salmonis]